VDLTAARAVLFDMDGTLVRSEHVHRMAWQGFFDHWAVAIDEDTYERTVKGRRARDVLARMEGPWPDVGTALAVLADQPSGTVDVVPGAVETLHALAAAGTPVAIVTSAGAAWARQVLEDVLGVHAPVLVTAEMVAEGKPSPEGYLLACKRLRVPPGDCAAVEDSPSGVRALVAAGVGTIIGITTTSDAGDLRDAGAHRTVADLATA
jgi:sugar-phosphatase